MKETNLILPSSNNPLQWQLEELKEFAEKKLLKIKEKKTNLMKFNFAKNYDFPPELSIGGFSNQLEVIRETKLLGVIITDDLRWAANTEYICKRAYKRMWTLRRMKRLDVEPYVMLDVYMKEIRAVLELAVPAWHSGLTKRQAAEIERVQRVACNIILSDSKTGICDFSYDMALVTLGLEPLEVRRRKLCETFARKTLNSRHSSMFSLNLNQYQTRNRCTYSTYIAKTKRCYNSPLIYLTRLLNGKEQ